MTTTTDYDDLAATRPERRASGLGRAIRAWLIGVRQRREARQVLHELMRLDRHLLRDMGINPADVREALAGRNSSVWLDPMRRFDDE